MRKVTVAATQMACSWDRQATLDKAESLVRKAAGQGANIILLQELFETPYFPQQQDFKYYDLAKKLEDDPAIQRFTKVAKELQVVLPISFYEKTDTTQFNSIAIIDADGQILGVYRKTHIPDGLPYAEKFYFTPGDTGFKVWQTKYGRIGVGICWDQWFPEAARAMALLGAELLFYPTAIGNEPTLKIDSSIHWRNTIAGHAAANMVPVVISNRIGKEAEGGTEMSFYGQSFIADYNGVIVERLDDHTEGVVLHTFDLDQLDKERRDWGIYRDRRPDMYKVLTTRGI